MFTQNLVSTSNVNFAKSIHFTTLCLYNSPTHHIIINTAAANVLYVPSMPQKSMWLPVRRGVSTAECSPPIYAIYTGLVTSSEPATGLQIRPRPRLNTKSFRGMGIPMLKIRRSWDRLIFNTGIPILVRRHIYIETVPRTRVGEAGIWGMCKKLHPTVLCGICIMIYIEDTRFRQALHHIHCTNTGFRSTRSFRTVGVF